MGAMASEITSLTIVYSIVYSGADQRKHQSSASLAFDWGIHRWPVNSPHKWPATRKMFPLDDVIMSWYNAVHHNNAQWATQRQEYRKDPKYHSLFMPSTFYCHIPQSQPLPFLILQSYFSTNAACTLSYYAIIFSIDAAFTLSYYAIIVFIDATFTLSYYAIIVFIDATFTLSYYAIIFSIDAAFTLSYYAIIVFIDATFTLSYYAIIVFIDATFTLSYYAIIVFIDATFTLSYYAIIFFHRRSLYPFLSREHFFHRRSLYPFLLCGHFFQKTQPLPFLIMRSFLVTIIAHKLAFAFCQLVIRMSIEKFGMLLKYSTNVCYNLPIYPIIFSQALFTELIQSPTKRVLMSYFCIANTVTRRQLILLVATNDANNYRHSSPSRLSAYSSGFVHNLGVHIWKFPIIYMDFICVQMCLSAKIVLL